MKGLLASALSLVLVGCVEVPTPFSVVSLAASGVSLVTTGKTIGDHMLSVVREEDCAVWRVLQNKPVCAPFQGNTPAIVALLDRQTYYAAGIEDNAGTNWSSPAPSQAPTQFASDPRGLAPERIDVAQLADLRPAAGNGFNSGAGADSTGTAPALADFRPAIAPAPAENLQRGRAAIVAGSAGAIDPSMLAADLMSYVVVIGSHPARDRAEAQAVRYTKLRPSIVPTLEDGQRRHHVILGPFANSELPTAWATLTHYGIEDAWLVRVRT